MEESMKQRGLNYGIKFNYDGNVRQTTDSHRMIWKAREVGGEKTQLALVDKLFHGYFEQASRRILTLVHCAYDYTGQRPS